MVERYRAAIDAESAVADHDRWADGRSFTFDRVLDAPREVVWRHWVAADLLESWLAPPSMTITECVQGGTRLRLGLTITETSLEAVPYIAGIGTGWGQVLDNLADTLGTTRT